MSAPRLAHAGYLLDPPDFHWWLERLGEAWCGSPQYRWERYDGWRYLLDHPCEAGAMRGVTQGAGR